MERVRLKAQPDEECYQEFKRVFFPPNSKSTLCQTIVSALPKLTKAELSQVAFSIKALQSLEPESEDDWLLSGIGAVLAARGLMHAKGADNNLKRSRAYTTYKSKSPAIRSHLQSHIANISRAQLYQLGRLAAEALALNIEEWAVVSPHLMLGSIDKMPEALDKAYPGYLRAGMLGWILGNRG